MKDKSILFTVSIIALIVFIIVVSTLLIQHKKNLVYLSSYQEANNLLKDSQYNEALEILKSIYPKFRGETRIEILYKIGICYQKIGETSKAEQYWNKVLDSSYSFYHPIIYYEFAQQKLREGNFEQAELYYAKIIEKFPTNTLAADAMLGPVDIYAAKGEFEKAKEYCEKIIESSNSLRIKEIAIDKLGDINMKLLSSAIPTQISETYSVKTGDTLSAIARNFNTTVSLIMQANNLKTTIIRPGQKLKVTSGNKFSILINISQNELFLNYNGKLFKRYKISSGADSATPLGAFEIKEKIKDPPWYTPEGKVIPPNSADNILGSRWMGLWESGAKTSYGIHEAIDPADIGQYVTKGCIRMVKEELEQLYDIVPIGTQVKIVNSKTEDSLSE